MAVSRLLPLLLLVIGVAVMMAPADPSKARIAVFSWSPRVDRLLEPHRAALGADYDGYRNHILRTLSYAYHWKKGQRKVMEAALVYHDLALWTDKRLDYIQPSVALMRAELGASRTSDGEREYTDEELDVAEAIILQHHKLTPYAGPHAVVVNAVRKADWLDATRGLVRADMPADNIALVKQELPPAGFYSSLLSAGPKYYGWDVLRIVREISTIFAF
jgi:hypothetical protein